MSHRGPFPGKNTAVEVQECINEDTLNAGRVGGGKPALFSQIPHTWKINPVCNGPSCIKSYHSYSVHCLNYIYKNATKRSQFKSEIFFFKDFIMESNKL